MIAHPEEKEITLLGARIENTLNILSSNGRKNSYPTLNPLFCQRNHSLPFQRVNESPLHNQNYSIQSLPRLAEKYGDSPYFRNDFPNWESEIGKTRKKYGLPIPPDNKALKMKLPMIVKVEKEVISNENLRISEFKNNEREILARNKMIEYANLVRQINLDRMDKNKQNVFDFDYQSFSPISMLDQKRKKNIAKLLDPITNEKYVRSPNKYSLDKKTNNMSDNDYNQNIYVNSLESLSPQAGSTKNNKKDVPSLERKVSQSGEISSYKSSDHLNIKKTENNEAKSMLISVQHEKPHRRLSMKNKLASSVAVSEKETQLSKIQKQIYLEKMRSLVQEKLQKRKDTFDTIMQASIKIDMDNITSELKKFMVKINNFFN